MTNGITVNYNAGTSITISPGFTAEAGVTFSAGIAGYNVGIEEVYAERFAIANYLNPFSNKTQVIYYLEKHTQVSLYISDLMGRPVAILIEGEKQSVGEHKVDFSIRSGLFSIY